MLRPAAPAGYTLIEMLLASASASVLVVGLTSSLYVASKTLDMEDGSAVVRVRDSRAVAQLLDDVSEALSFTERTATAMTFTVPDRTGDGRPDEIRYAWSGAEGDPLVYTFNGAASSPIEAVASIEFTFLTRTLEAAGLDASETVGVVFEEVVDEPQGADATTISIPTPPGAAEGDLLIAAVAIDDDQSSVAGAAGWSLEHFGKDSSDKVALGVWSRVVEATEPSSHSFGWTESAQAYGWIMRFTGHDPAAPIHAIASATGKSDDPECPTVTASVDGCLILRIGGFDDDDTQDDAGMSGHTSICAGDSGGGSGSASGAAAYATLDEAGDSGEADFSLDDSEQYRTVTIAIAPETGS